MKVLRVVLAILVILLSAFSFITGYLGALPYALLLVGVMLFVMGMIETKEKRIENAFTSFLSAAFCIVVSLYIIVR